MKIRQYAHDSYAGFFHWCPGCGHAHRIETRNPAFNWTWDGNQDAPTCSPSVRHYLPANEDGPEKTLCHYFLRAGNIEFCGDCVHALKGQTVPMPDFPEDYVT